jgi:hypothetical protein
MEIIYILDAEEELRGLVDKVREMKSKLREQPNIEVAGKLNEVLEEVNKTYKVVDEAITEYLTLGLKSKPLDDDPAALVKLASGKLEVMIEEDRGNATTVVDIYFTVLRRWFKDVLNGDEQTKMDWLLGDLDHADTNIFIAMEEIGWYLTDEAKEVVGLIIAGNLDQAKARVKAAYNELQPLQRTVMDNMKKLYTLKRELDAISGKV